MVDASAVSATAAIAAAASAYFSSSPSSLPIAHAPTNQDDDTPPKTDKVLFITAIYGGYEKTLKEPAKQQHPADFIAFTDRTDLASPTWQIRLVEDPLDYLLKHGGRVGVGGSGSVYAAAANANAGETAAASVAEEAGKGHGTAAEQAGRQRSRHGSCRHHDFRHHRRRHQPDAKLPPVQPGQGVQDAV